MRDLLPDLLHDRLPAALRVEVQTHVAGCADCRAELAILRSVVAIAVVPRVDTTRIAAAVPPYRAMPRWRRTVVSPAFRIAAAVVLLVGGAGLIAVVANRQREAKWPQRIVEVPVSPKSEAPSISPSTTPAAGAAPAPKTRSTAPTELALGESFHDLSDSELRALLGEMEKFEAMTPAETEIVVPSPGRGAQ
jgi:hypothetical protein